LEWGCEAEEEKRERRETCVELGKEKREGTRERDGEDTEIEGAVGFA
jgi:hypothetical protein